LNVRGLFSLQLITWEVRESDFAKPRPARRNVNGHADRVRTARPSKVASISVATLVRGRQRLPLEAPDGTREGRGGFHPGRRAERVRSAPQASRRYQAERKRKKRPDIRNDPIGQMRNEANCCNAVIRTSSRFKVVNGVWQVEGCVRVEVGRNGQAGQGDVLELAGIDRALSGTNHCVTGCPPFTDGEGVTVEVI
jgi:hypothetical protein